MKKFVATFLFAVLSLPVFAGGNPVARGNFVFTVPLVQYGQGTGDLYKEGDMSVSREWQVGFGSIGCKIGGFGMGGGAGFNIGLQYFVIDGLAAGVDLGYDSIKVEDEANNVLTAGPQLAYYLNFDGVMPYAGAGYIWKRFDFEDDTGESYFTSLSFKAGAAVMMSNYLALFGEVSYSFDSTDEEESSDDEDGKWLAFTAGVKAFF